MAGRRREIDDLQGEIQELFADMWQVSRFSRLRHGFRPQADCFRTDEPPALTVVVELPGVDPASVEVLSTGSAVVISGSRERPNTAGARYQHMEIEYGPFQRRVELGAAVDSSQATASYERGLLRIVLPIAEQSPPEQRIAIAIGPR
ncbi:MAG: Hsp20/alpha crystallin family protein [Gaiellaceae bacterium]